MHKLDSSRVLVTGACGFLGTHLLDSLLACGAQVNTTDRLGLPSPYAGRPSLHHLQGDLEQLLGDHRLRLAEYDFIFHLSGTGYVPYSVERPADDFTANLELTFALLEAMRREAASARLINISSAAVYGRPARIPIREEDPTVPLSPYGVSKLAGERYVSVYSQLYGLKAVSLRIFSTYGPGQRKLVVYDLFDKLYHDPDRLEILGDGSQGRDFIYISDVVNGLLLAAENAPASGEVYNLASGNTVRISELAERICEVCHMAPKITYTGRSRAGDPDYWQVDISRLKSLGFTPGTLLTEGLKAVQRWYEASNR